MTVLTAPQETDFDEFDLDLRVVPAETAVQDERFTDTATPFCPGSPTPVAPE